QHLGRSGRGLDSRCGEERRLRGDGEGGEIGERAVALGARLEVTHDRLGDDLDLRVGERHERGFARVLAVPGHVPRKKFAVHASSTSDAAIVRRPRFTHVATVPSGTSRRRAISWYSSPSRWNIVSAFLCPSGKVSMTLRTSSARRASATRSNGSGAPSTS